MLVAGVQMEITGEPRGNFETMNRWAERTLFLYPHAKLLVFPELAYTGPVHPGLEEGEVLEKFSSMARDLGVWLIPGSFYIKTAKGKVNRAYLFSPEGEVVGHYDKIYPWRPYEDSIPGNRTRVFDLEGFKVGIEICYDIWFPEIALEMAELGVELIVNPVMTTTADREGEEVLVRATALFTQSYVLSVNGLGRGGVGLSLGVDPEGKIMARAQQAEAIIPLEVLRERLNSVRERGSFSSNRILKERREK